MSFDVPRGTGRASAKGTDQIGREQLEARRKIDSGYDRPIMVPTHASEFQDDYNREKGRETIIYRPIPKDELLLHQFANIAYQLRRIVVTGVAVCITIAILSHVSAQSEYADIRYWIGGSGSVQGNHWSLTSGGSISPSIPRAGTVIIFDSNSGSGTAIVDIPIFTTGPVFITGANISVRIENGSVWIITEPALSVVSIQQVIDAAFVFIFLTVMTLALMGAWWIKKKRE